jgi:hypothetical protein
MTARWADDDEDDFFVQGFVTAILEAERAAEQIMVPKDRSMAYAAIAAAYAACL